MIGHLDQEGTTPAADASSHLNLAVIPVWVNHSTTG
jgi:hypothetical protein